MAASDTDVTVLTTDLSSELPLSFTAGTRRPAVSRLATLDLSVSVARARRQGHQGAYDLGHVQGVNNLSPPMTLAAAQRAGIPALVIFHTRALSGVAMVTSDDHAGLVNAIAAVLPGATWQRCQWSGDAGGFELTR